MHLYLTFVAISSFFLVDGSLNNQFSGFLTDIVESIEMPEPSGSGGGNVSAYFYDIFTDIWISQRMVLDVARLIKENPGYKIYVNSIVYLFSINKEKILIDKKKHIELMGGWKINSVYITL